MINCRLWGVYEAFRIIVMSIEPGVQTFNKYMELEHVFKSDKLKVVSDKGVTYKEGFNESKGNRVLAICKYTKLSNLEKSVNGRNFYFGSPYEWLDPFELLFYKPKMFVNQENNNITIHASCFACNDIENEEGFWQIWSKGEKEPIVRVLYNVNKLLTSLNYHADGHSFYLGGMEYETRDKIMSQNSMIDSYESIDDYLNKLCLKRNAYKYEHELRLFSKRISDNDNYVANNTIINDIDYNDGIIAEITLPPAEPFGNSHPAKDKMKEFQKCVNLLAKQRIQKMINNGLLTCKINQSALYCANVKKRTY